MLVNILQMNELVHKCIVLLCVLPVVFCIYLEQEPIVRTTYGSVRGKIIYQPDEDLTQYYAFKGIPYAAPPVGKLRFKDPQEPESWTGIKNAQTYGPKCLQRATDTGNIEGDEDCLYLNVFNPLPPSTWHHKKLPVSVWLHPGMVGSGNLELYGPDPLISSELVIVSLNYRYGVLGFLNTQDTNAPGNAGIKDIILALKWVKKNIGAFGGDADKVLAVGDGMGGALVSFLMLAPQAEGLIHRAMSMSGTAISNWAFYTQPRKAAYSLANYVKQFCHGYQHNTFACLQNVDAKHLIENQNRVLPDEMVMRLWNSAFVPTIEAPGTSNDSVLTADPESLLRSGKFHRIPQMMGFNSADAIYYMWKTGLMTNASHWGYFNKYFPKIMFPMMPRGLQTNVAVRKMRDYYLGDCNLSDGFNNLETQNKFALMATDLIYGLSSVNTARLVSERGVDVYFYEFAYEFSSSYFKNKVFNASKLHGLAHGDQVFSVFKSNVEENAQRKLERVVQERAVRIIKNFITEGNPTPFKTHEYPIWQPFSPKNESYYYLNTGFVNRNPVLDERHEFWRDLIHTHSQYRY